MRIRVLSGLLGGAVGLALAGAAVGDPAPGDRLVTEFCPGSIVNVAAGGDVSGATRFATGLTGPAGICRGPGGLTLVAEFDAGEVTAVDAGGDLSAQPAYASGLSSPASLLCSGSRVLVSEYVTGEITDITEGGDFTGAPAFATGLPLILGLFRDSRGRILAASQTEGVFDVTAGGSFAAATPLASGVNDLESLAEFDDRLLVTSEDEGLVVDFAAGGDLTTLPVFASIDGASTLIDLGPFGLFVLQEGETPDGALVDISAGGDFPAPTPLASGFDNCGSVSALLAVPTCPALPIAACEGAAKGKLSISEKRAGAESLSASLSGFPAETVVGDFGNPAEGGTAAVACIYDQGDALVANLVVDRGGDDHCTLSMKPKACWKRRGSKGYAYADPGAAASGIRKLSFASGKAGKGKIKLSAGNKAAKGQTELPTGIAASLAGATAALVQVFASDGTCFEAALGTVKKADGVSFSAVTP
jgi:hypothetical protein